LLRQEPDIDRSAFEAELDRIRQRGYVVVVDELDMGAHSVAAPIRDHFGEVIAAISIARPSNRFPPERVEHYIDLVLQAAEQISEALGYRQLHANSHRLSRPGREL
jgi:DNA-binding IclR family transcriptional regulator